MRGIVGRLTMLGMVFALIAGCGASGPKPDVSIRGSITAVDSVNPNSSGRASPLRIHIFELAAIDQFNAAEYFDLTDDPQGTLGTDLLDVEPILVTPGESRPYNAEYDPETRFIGVVAGYREIHQATWRATVEMPGRSIMNMMQRGSVVIRADRLAISVTVEN